MAAATRAKNRRSLGAEHGHLLIADISGYTSYVVESPLEHAEDVLADVTATVADALGHVLRLNKFEGDAVFGYALAGETDATMLLDAIEECYFAFRRRLEGIGHSTSCSCKACAKLPDLDLKFVLHSGAFIRRGTRGREEVTGGDVILVHRLLKNRVAEALGTRGYLLMTEAAATTLGLDAQTLGLRPHSETYDEIGEVRAFVLDLEKRFLTEKERRRVFIAPEDAGFEVDAHVSAPPPVVWEYLTAPPKRALWSGTTIEEETDGGRRGAGTTSYCVDGRSRVYEEILDWRPFHYFTERRTLRGPVRLILTTELEPDGDGTRVRTRGRRLSGRERFAWVLGGRRVVARLRGGYDRLARAIQADDAARRRDMSSVVQA